MNILKGNNDKFLSTVDTVCEHGVMVESINLVNLKNQAKLHSMVFFPLL